MDLTKAIAKRSKQDWKIGDIAVRIVDTYGNERDPITGLIPLAMAAQVVNIRLGTLRQREWVSRAFPREEDRQFCMPWTVYRAAAASSDPVGWVTRASVEKWSADRLIWELKAAKEMKKIGHCSSCGELLRTTDISGLGKISLSGRSMGRFCCRYCAHRLIDSIFSDAEK